MRDVTWQSPNHTGLPPRHLVSGDSYFITAVTQEYADRYWCQAECRENRTEAKGPASLAWSVSGTSGVYWCEGARGRSNAVNITVSCESCVTEKFQDKLRKKPPTSV
ncbi:unnamed protein product [Pleuronectes platessa]|uniref:Ig-like domain-containing protein n=1 Tax=Pleuronectes platessa TaxID=8262 RepID=A0A9N7VA78_PLEPL|nr:unnamed protein product [Pleuronectes platessa]